MQPRLMLIEQTPDDGVILHLDGVALPLSVTGPLAMDTAQRIALCGNLHYQQTPDEIADSGRHIFLKGVEAGIDAARAYVGTDNSLSSEATKLTILNNFRLKLDVDHDPQ